MEHLAVWFSSILFSNDLVCLMYLRLYQ
jgi:hypothetical protein